jgi:sulfur carrier protein ThiS
MDIEVKLHGTLRRHRPADIPGAPHHPFPLSVANNITLHDLAAQLGIAEGLINAAAVNGDAVELATLLQDGDKVHFFPPSAGG